MTQARDLADGKFDTSTLVVDAANNRIGIGTASPAVNLDIVEDSSSTDAILGITAGTGGRAQIRSEAQSDGTSSVLSFHTMSSSNTSEVGRWLAGGGLTFNGDTAAANALDDYEEGTWTPAYSGTSVATTHTYTQQMGRYVKVGDIVHAYFVLQTSATSGGSGSVIVTGLPYTISSASIYVAGSIGFSSSFDTDDCPTGILGNYGGTTMFIYKRLSSSSQTNLGVNDLVTGNGNEMYASISYRAN